MHFHTCRERHGIRAWWHFRHPACFRVECYWWSPFFGLSFGPDDEGWNISVKCPPFAIYLSFDGMGLWQPTRTCIATWDNDRVFTIPDEREFSFTISDWTLRLALWSRAMEWRSEDPWWIRGVSLDIKDLLLGKVQYTADTLSSRPVQIPMPEGVYPAIARVELAQWKRPRWFTQARISAWLDIPKGIPHAGKGENSWDCGDDGLFGIGGSTIEDAIRRAQEAVMDRRRRYGHASDAAMKEALQ